MVVASTTAVVQEQRDLLVKVRWQRCSMRVMLSMACLLLLLWVMVLLLLLLVWWLWLMALMLLVLGLVM